MALAEVTDEFLAHVARMRAQAGTGADGSTGLTRAQVDELTEFLVVAATLLDLKTARLLPTPEGGEEFPDPELLEARDLLFARLLQYRAYKQVSAWFAERMDEVATRVPRAVPLEDDLQGVLPPLQVRTDPAGLASLMVEVLTREPEVPTVDLTHLHVDSIDLDAERDRVLGALQAAAARGETRVGFEALTLDADGVLVVVARFLALLELFKAGYCLLHQDAPLGDLFAAPQELAA